MSLARLFKTAGRSTFRPVYKHELNSHDWRKGDSRLKALFQSRPLLLYFWTDPSTDWPAVVSRNTYKFYLKGPLKVFVDMQQLRDLEKFPKKILKKKSTQIDLKPQEIE